MKHMSKDTLNYRLVPLFLSLIVGLGTFISLWPSNFLGFAPGNNYAQTLLFIFLGTGMLFFFVGNNKLMVICLAGCALICYELNERTHSAFKPALAEHQELIRIGIFQLYPDYQDLDESLEMMCNSSTDLINIKAIPNLQFTTVKEKLDLCGYNFHRCLGGKSAGLFKEVVFSKHTFAYMDTLYLPHFGDNGNLLSKGPTDKNYNLQKVFNPDEFRYIKFEPVNYKSDQAPMGIIQTYQLIHQEPAIHDKKPPQKL